MTTTSRTFHVGPAPTTVLNYLKDFSHAEEWDPGTVSCTQNGSGSVRVGTSWHNVSKIAGNETELTYTLVEMGDDRVVFEGKNEQATALDTITVVPKDGGSEVTYTAELTMHGAAKLATPIMKLVFEKLGNDTEDDMVRVLDRLA